MNRDAEVDLIRRTLDLVDRKGELPSRTLSRISIDRYSDPERFRREKEVLFREFPLLVGFSSEVSGPGDYFTHDASGVPIVVVRQPDGRLTAFLNVCRHRGCRVVDTGKGRAEAHLTCPFHGWRYGIDGRLLAVTHPDCFPGIDRSELGLVPLAVAERFGMVFVLPTPGETFDVDEWLGPLIQDLDSLGFDGYRMIRPKRAPGAMNWKLMMDANLETYHIAFLHRETAGMDVMNNLHLFDWERPMLRGVLPRKSISGLSRADSTAWRLTDHAAILYGIFPNSKLLLLEGYGFVLSTWPVDVGRSLLLGGTLVPPGDPPAEEVARRVQTDITYWSTMEEDVAAAEAQQLGLASGANDHFLVGWSEHILARYHGALDDALAGRLRP